MYIFNKMIKWLNVAETDKVAGSKVGKKAYSGQMQKKVAGYGIFWLPSKKNSMIFHRNDMFQPEVDQVHKRA